jgi:hypothetical protein
MNETPDFSAWPLDERVAAQLGIAADTAPGMVELCLAVRDPEGYAEVIRAVDNTALWLSFDRMDRVHRGAVAGIQFVEPSMRRDFLGAVAGLRESCRLEAARRGISLESWPNLSPEVDQ